MIDVSRSQKDFSNILGTNIIYKDYLGYQRYGKIGWVEPYEGDQDQEDEKQVVWIYVSDEDPEYNVHEFIVNVGTIDKPDIKHIMYADMRLSTEVYLDET